MATLLSIFDWQLMLRLVLQVTVLTTLVLLVMRIIKP